MLGEVDNNAVTQRLTVGARAAPPGAKYDIVEARFSGESTQCDDIVSIEGIDYRLGENLVDRVVGGQRDTVAIVAGNVAAKWAANSASRKSM